jgi:hypothetical protein
MIDQKELYHGENKLILKLDDGEVRFVPDQHADMDFYCASSLKQQSADRYVAPLRHIILIPSQPVFALSPIKIQLRTTRTSSSSH